MPPGVPVPASMAPASAVTVAEPVSAATPAHEVLPAGTLVTVIVRSVPVAAEAVERARRGRCSRDAGQEECARKRYRS